MTNPRDVERHPMKVWPNRYRLDQIDRAKERARAEGTDPASLLRRVLDVALESPQRIMPNGDTPAGCAHELTRQVGYVTVCCSCLTPLDS